MNTQQMSDDMARQTARAGGRRLDSILRTLTVAVALLAFGVSAPMAVADHMGNHERPLEELAGPQATAESPHDCGLGEFRPHPCPISTDASATDECGHESGERGSTDATTQTQLAVSDGGVSTVSRAGDAGEPDEMVPPRPLNGRPW